MPLMIFCDVQIAQAREAEKPNQTKERRAVASDPAKYREVVLKHCEWSSMIEGKIIQTIFQGLGVGQEAFMKSMQLYMQDPQIPQTIEQFSMSKRYAREREQGAPPLMTKEEVIKTFTAQIDIKCETFINLTKRPAATDMAEK